MTRNQIEYQKLQESIRSNKVNESLTAARDVATMDLRKAELGETSRHNKATERETMRSHSTSEAEVKRHNQMVEDISRAELYSRNLSAEASMKQAEAAHKQAAAAARQASVAEYNAQTNAAKLAEDIRYHNVLSSQEQRAMDIDARRVDASMIQANTQRYLSQFEPERISLNARDVSTREQTAASNIDYNAARSENVRKETSYMGQQNVRDWIDTGGSAFKNITSGISAISKFALPNKVLNVNGSEYFTTD